MTSNPNKIISLQELINAQVDAKVLELIMNEAPLVEVETRLGRKCYSISTIQAIIDQYKLQADMEIANLTDAINVALAAGAGAAGWTASLVVDGDKTQQQINENQTLFNNKYSKFKQSESGGIEQDLSQRARKEQYINDYATAQDAFNVKRNAASYVYIPNGQYNIEGSLNLTGSHFIEGQGDYSILAFSGENNGIVTAAGSKYDDHAKRTIQNLRINGDRPSGTATHGTTRGLYVSGHGHAGEVKGVTFNGHDVGYYLGLNYTSRGCYNMYRANRIGLHLHSVTSYREESIYARYNTEAAILITGSNQNITFAGGAIEGNSGRAIWARDLVVNSNMQITLDDVYLEVNGNEALGIPSVELQEIEKMEVIVNGGSYWYNLNNGVYSGPYMWGNSVSFHGSSLQGFHYAKQISLDNALQAPIMNTTKLETTSRLYGLREPAMVTKYRPHQFSPTMFQVQFLKGIPDEIVNHTNSAITTYPYVSSTSGVTTSEDTASDYGEGSFQKLDFSVAGSYNANYATLFTTAHAANEMSVYVFAIKANTDAEIGLVGVDSATRDLSYFKLKAGKTYKFVRTFNGLAGTTERLRMFSIQGTVCSVSFKPLAVYHFTDKDKCHRFIDSMC